MIGNPEEYLACRPKLKKYIYRLLRGDIIPNESEANLEEWWKHMMNYCYGVNRPFNYTKLHGRSRHIDESFINLDMLTQRALLRYSISAYVSNRISDITQNDVMFINRNYYKFASTHTITPIPKEIVKEKLAMRGIYITI